MKLPFTNWRPPQGFWLLLAAVSFAIGTTALVWTNGSWTGALIGVPLMAVCLFSSLVMLFHPGSAFWEI